MGHGKDGLGARSPLPNHVVWDAQGPFGLQGSVVLPRGHFRPQMGHLTWDTTSEAAVFEVSIFREELKLATENTDESNIFHRWTSSSRRAKRAAHTAHFQRRQ